MLADLGVDVGDAFARPVTPEIVGVADIIVTMGNSVGVFGMPPDVRHEDWRVGDPLGAPLGEVRHVADDIEHRVRTLLADLGAPSGGDGRPTPLHTLAA